jgi:thiol-disulfide isomerase/thioredoxin
LVHYPAFKNKLQFYFEKMLLQQADTICVNAHELIKQIENGSEMFKYVVHFITYKYETSKIMGMDAVFYCMADSYYCPPDKSRAYWLDPDKLKELCERKDAIGPLRVGQPAPRVILADTSEKKWVDFYTQVKTDYTALIFWADDCGHCKKEMPKLIKLYNELKEKNISIEFVAVGTSLENKGWKKFIKENNLPWINISDFPDANENAVKYLNELRVTDLQSLNFRKTYDIFSTPQIYLLDKDKVIRAKKLDAKNLAKILEHKLSIDLDYEEPEEEEKKKEDTH